MVRTLSFQNQIRSTTSGIEFIDDLDLIQAEIIIDDDSGAFDDPAEVSGTIIYDFNFIRTALRDIKGDTPTFKWSDSVSTTSGLISLADIRDELFNLQAYTGSTGDGDGTPVYSSTAFINPNADLTEAIGQLDAAITTISGVAPQEIQKRLLVNVGAKHSKHGRNTSLDIENPGTDWEVTGDSITIPGSGTFVESVSVFYNGALLLNGADVLANRDVYFVAAPNEIAFDFDLKTKTVLQIWKFPPS